jgi:hypothetical protein
MSGARIAYRDIKKGLVMRRGGNPKTPQGAARKAETFTVTDVHGDPSDGYSRAKLEGHGRAFWVYPVHLVDKWEKA